MASFRLVMTCRLMLRLAPGFLLDLVFVFIVSGHLFIVRCKRTSESGTILDFSMPSVFESAGGIDGLSRLARAWHRRVMADEVVGHAFSHGFHPQHVERLAAYWAEALGGPSLYSDSYGDETAVVKMHSGNGEHQEMDRRAIDCFDQALVDVGLAGDSALRQVLHDYFAWATTTTMARYHRSADDVPDGLSIPKWSWSGLIDSAGAYQIRMRYQS